MIRRRIALAGFAIIGLYIGGAALSGSLSPLARRPILDGTVAVAPYNWVSPPSELAGTNQPPGDGRRELRLVDGGSKPDVVSTSDLQWTMIAEEGAFERRGERAVELVAEPLDPATLPPLPGGLRAAGNAVRIEATYLPSGDSARRLGRPTQVTMVYPSSLTVHAPHSLLFSRDGEAWTSLETTDVPNIQQAGALIEAPGIVVVAGRSGGRASSVDQGSGSVAVVAGVIVACLALVGLGLATRFLRDRS